MIQNKIKGVGVALITPFNNYEVDYPALERMVEHVITGGVDYIVALGSTAETATLSFAERQRVLDFIIDHTAGRVPIVAGMGTNDTHALVEQLRTFDLSRTIGILSVVPYYNKPSQEGIYRHYMAVAEASPVPVIIYNVPGRTGVNMLPETTLRLATDCKNVVGIKEASGNVEQIEYILRNRPEGFKVFSGDDGITLPLIKSGADGVISVIGNAYAAEFAELVHWAHAGHFAEAEVIDKRLSELYRLIFVDGNPAGIKCLMELRGMIKNVLRLPLVPATQATCDKIAAQL